MPLNETQKATLKADILRHADHHRATCKGADCNMSLYTLKRLAEEAGITFTAEELEKFM